MSDVQPLYPSLTPPHPSEAPSFPASSLTTHFGRERLCVCVTVCTGTLALYGYFGAVWRLTPRTLTSIVRECAGLFLPDHMIYSRIQAAAGGRRDSPTRPNKLTLKLCTAQIQFDSIFLKMDQRKDFEVSEHVVPRRLVL